VDDDEPYREQLIKIIDDFEEKYDTMLDGWKGDIRPFRQYAISILGAFPYREFDFQMVPHILSKSEASPDRHVNIPWSVGETDVKIQTIVKFINGRRTIQEIMDAANYSLSETKAIFSMLDRYKWIRLDRKLGPGSYLKKLSEPPMYLIGAYGDQLKEIVERFDGTLSMEEVCESLQYTVEVVTTIARNLIDAGVLGYVETEK